MANIPENAEEEDIEERQAEIDGHFDMLIFPSLNYFVLTRWQIKKSKYNGNVIKQDNEFKNKKYHLQNILHFILYSCLCSDGLVYKYIKPQS